METRGETTIILDYAMSALIEYVNYGQILQSRARLRMIS